MLLFYSKKLPRDFALRLISTVSQSIDTAPVFVSGNMKRGLWQHPLEGSRNQETHNQKLG
jgi:hypothetical protein